MGCVASRIDREERVQICRERKRLMKQLVGFRGEFENAQLSYMRALKNTGVTLRQFTESELLELEDTFLGVALPSPPPPLPPSPPPPPPLSPDLRKFDDNEKEEISQQESVEIMEDDTCTPPPPAIPDLSWDFWDPFDNSLLHQSKPCETVDQLEEENWAETKTEFEEDDQDLEVVSKFVANSLREKPVSDDLIDDNSSMASSYAKETTGATMVVWKNKKNLVGIIRELDDYFLKASASGKDLAVFIDIKRGSALHNPNSNENKRKRSNSKKVFTALSWSWSSKSLQVRRDVDSSDPTDPCRPGAHCITLEKLYIEEQKLYKDVKEEAITKLEHEKKSLLLLKQEEEDHHDLSRADKTRLSVDKLQSDVHNLQQSISGTCSCILKIIDEELHRQMVVLTSGMMRMWRTMYECHQVQNHISQQLSHISHNQTPEPTSAYLREATSQLEHEVTSWYNSFCKLIKSQRDYVTTFCQWIQLTDCLVDDQNQSRNSSIIRNICEEWQAVLDRLPEKVASEAIKCLVSAIHSILLQQAEEQCMQRRSNKLEERLRKELESLAEMEMKLEFSNQGDAPSPSPRHPISLKRAKVEGLKKRVHDEKAKYVNSVQVSHAMTFNNLKTSLPNVFEALMSFAGACAQAFEAIHSRTNPAGDSLQEAIN